MANTTSRLNSGATWSTRCESVRVPQLEVTAPGVVPVPVEVEQDVETAVEAQPRMAVEVGVDPQVAAGLDRVQAAALEVGVDDQPRDAGQGSPGSRGTPPSCTG